MPSWSFRWEQLRQPIITITPSQARTGLQFVELQFDLTVGSHGQIVAAEWVPEHAPQEVAWRFEDTVQASSAELADLLLRLPLLQHLVQQRGCTPQIEPAALRRAPFYFGCKRYSVTVGGLFTLCLWYSIVDGILVRLGPWHEASVTEPLWEVIGLASIGFWGLLCGLLRRGKIPWVQTLGASLAVAVAFGMALLPGLLRLNLLTDTQGTQSYTYTLTAIGAEAVLFTPPHTALPTLVFDDAEYWQQHPLDSPHAFALRQGGLGFFQLDLRTLHEAVDAWDKGRRALKETGQ